MKKELKNNNHILQTVYTVDQLKQIAKEVKDDFLARQAARKPFESQWQLNINFELGNQNCIIGRNSEVIDNSNQFYWQEREVFNHIAPLMDARYAKLTRIKPKMTVVPASTDEKDIYTAKVSKKIIDSLSHKLNLSGLIAEATRWSEITGSAFYKVVWSDAIGRKIAVDEQGNPIFEGDVDVTVCSPFEIYPDSNSAEDIDSCQSIIHARAYHVDQIKNTWGIDVEGSEIDIFTLDNVTTSTVVTNPMQKATSTTKANHAIVIERYEAPTEQFVNGRLIIVAGDEVLHIDELPFINRPDNKRGFPFIMQKASQNVGCFWGTSIIQRTIPVQRAYNAVKNRKHEFLNRLSMGVLTVEDGSIDTEALEEEGIAPGKVIVYRQGSTPPSLMPVGNVPLDFTREEDRLLNEFMLISGVSDLMRSSTAVSANTSGITLQLMLEQDDVRMGASAESIRQAIANVAKNILRLYKQFALSKRMTRIVGINGAVDMFYFKASDISSDDVIFETENELGETLAQKRNMVFELLRAGLLHDENGKLSNSMRSKALDLLGFGIWQGAQDITSLHIKKADTENIDICKNLKKTEVDEIDDHELHINEHIAFMLSNEFEKLVTETPSIKKAMLNHIRTHKQMASLTAQMELLQ